MTLSSVLTTRGCVPLLTIRRGGSTASLRLPLSALGTSGTASSVSRVVHPRSRRV
eukprot:CAMPEP_0168626350 /NCGR_PEP_ID=MMETSP0449_2-20121227/10580_1 /TAXON_ID=1082188 /ORGANISM="Strombidium rassoulzadegani, Strain ras09" /LENGTH=54 /DNA_ID=CAMNT_0008668329 /DNA_START=18 /DNA_END=178 /DNA_ORIENTATION=-